MTEIEFLHEMVKAAGGNPDMLQDKLKSTYYECLINCLNSGGGSGGGSTGGGNDKVIVGVKDGDNITFTKTPAEIFALSDDIQNYDIVLIEYKDSGNTIYRFARIVSKTTELLSLELSNVFAQGYRRYNVIFRKDNTVTYTQDYVNFYRLPDPVGKTNQYLAVRGGTYQFVDIPEIPEIPEPTDNPLLQAIDNGGTLVAVHTKPLMELVSNAIESGNVHVNLVVLTGMVANGIAERYDIYSLLRVDEVTSGSPYGIFFNGIDKVIRMDVEGNFSYAQD